MVMLFQPGQQLIYSIHRTLIGYLVDEIGIAFTDRDGFQLVCHDSLRALLIHTTRLKPPSEEMNLGLIR